MLDFICKTLVVVVARDEKGYCVGMAVSPQAVANAFLQLADTDGKALTNMQLQKLVFLAQGYGLALLDKCIFEKNIHAWQWGPVIPKLYKALQKYGSGVVNDKVKSDDSLNPDSEEYGVVKGVWDAYGSFTGSQLSEITHRANSPWQRAWQKEPFSAIQPDDIKAYYKNLVSSS